MMISWQPVTSCISCLIPASLVKASAGSPCRLISCTSSIFSTWSTPFCRQTRSALVRPQPFRSFHMRRKAIEL